MKRILAISLLLIVGYANAYQFTKDDIDYFQPPVVNTEVPESRVYKYSLYNNTTRVNMSPMQPVVPTFKGEGKLLASWTPHPNGSKGRPTVVIVHGGHGLVPTDFATAVWARDELGANTLVLDSFWSRGFGENWATWTKLGANARMLDAIAAGRWLQTQDIDKDRVYLMGGSQGGWTVLRTFTDEPFIKENAQVRNVDRSTCDDKKNWIQTWRIHTNTSKKVLTCCYFGCTNEAKLGGKYINQY